MISTKSKDSISVWLCIYVHILFKKPFFFKILGPPSTQKVSCGTLKLPNRRRPFQWNIILPCPNSLRWISFRKKGVERVPIWNYSNYTGLPFLPINMVQWKNRCISNSSWPFQIQPFSTSMIMGEGVYPKTLNGAGGKLPTTFTCMFPFPKWKQIDHTWPCVWVCKIQYVGIGTKLLH